MVQMASPSATFILESVVCGHHIYKLDVGMFVNGRKYQWRLVVVLSMIDNNKLIDCISVHMYRYQYGIVMQSMFYKCVSLFL